MFYNSYAKEASDKFVNKILLVTCPEDFQFSSYFSKFAIPVFLAGGVIPDNDWRNEVIAYFKDNWKHNRGIVFFSPVRPTCNFNDVDDLRKQIGWEQKYMNSYGMLVSFYFPDSQYHQPMSFYELGRCLGKRTQDAFANWLGNDVLVSVHKDYFRKNDVILQTEVANVDKGAKEVESVAEFANNLMCYLEENYDTNIPLESSSERNCLLCKYFSETPTHGSGIMGDCLKKENMVWCPPDRYNGRHKRYKIVHDDDVCEYFENEKEEKEIEKFCLTCEHYQPKTLNNGYCSLDESKTIRCMAYICDKNI